MRVRMIEKRNLQFLKEFSLGILLCILLLSSGARAQWTPMNPVKSVQQEPDGAVFTMGTGTLKIQVCTDSVIHILYSPSASFPKQQDFVVSKDSWPRGEMDDAIH